MKKLLLILAVLMAPVCAQAITFTATDDAGVCTVTFDAGLEPNVPPVAMALTITVDGSDEITAVDGIPDFFDIYMDAAYDMENDPCTPGYTYGDGDAIAKVAEPGRDVLPSASFAISMGGLGGPTKPFANSPSLSGTAFVLHADNAAVGTTVTGTIVRNSLRGGVIGSDGEEMDTNIEDPIPFSITIEDDECMAATNNDYTTWSTLAGSPACWCYCKNCNGDVDGGMQFGGAVDVYTDDLAIFLPAFGLPDVATTPGHAGWCADLDREAQFGGMVRVYTDDLDIFLPAFGTKVQVCSGPSCDRSIDGAGGSDIGETCDANPLPNSEFNFWTSNDTAILPTTCEPKP
ncbi:MAG: hypothetical protein ACYTFK_06110 [Planctomycetota bacterium]